jgi:hypothetical protein
LLLWPAYHYFSTLAEYQPKVYPTMHTCCSEAEKD